MTHRPTLLACIGLALAGVSSSFGQGKVVYISDPAKELKRTAHHLRISVEQLKNARAALQEATDLARHSMDPSVYSQLANNWIRLDRARAPSALEDSYSWLRADARSAPDLQTYRRCTSACQALLSVLCSLDGELALSLMERWPEPPAWLGEPARSFFDQFVKQFSTVVAQRSASQNPELALQLLRDQAAGASDYSTRGQLASRLMQSGNRDEALKLVDQTMADFDRQNPDGRTLQSYLGFVRQLPNLDPGRFLQALDSLLPAVEMAAVNSNSGGGGQVTVGDESIDITPAEAAVIDICRNLSGRPDLTMKTLGMVPGLKTKLDSLGGIDSILRPSVYQGATSMTYSIGGTVRKSSTYPGTVPRGPDLMQSLRGKAIKDPEWVLKKLAEAAPGPEQINVLITLAGRAGFEDPDLACMALELAVKMVTEVEPLQNRSQTIQSLMRAYRNVEGEVSADLLKQGFVVVQLWREEENARPNLRTGGEVPSSRSIPNGADQLEMSLVAELALENFEGARSYVRLMPDELRLQALLRIIQNLAQSY